MSDDIEAIIETGSLAAIEIAASALAERGEKPGACKNCAHPLLGAYCAVCGQPTKTRRRSVRHLVDDFVKDIFNLDSRILRTARALLFRPGELPKAFREGRMQPYVPSIRLYLFVSLIFFVLLSLTKIAIVQIQVNAKPIKVVYQNGVAFIPNPAYEAGDNDPDVKKYVKPLIPIDKARVSQPGGVNTYSTTAHFFAPLGSVHSTLTKEQRAHLLEKPLIQMDVPNKKEVDWVARNIYSSMNRLALDPAALNEPLTAWIPRVLFVLLPLYALVLALFHIRRRKDFFLVDHLVFSLSIHSFTFVAVMLAVGLSQFLDGGLVAGGLFLLISAYIFLAMRNFYEQSWFMTSLKFVVISGLYTVFILSPAIGCVFLLSMFGDSLGF